MFNREYTYFYLSIDKSKLEENLEYICLQHTEPSRNQYMTICPGSFLINLNEENKIRATFGLRPTIIDKIYGLLHNPSGLAVFSESPTAGNYYYLNGMRFLSKQAWFDALPIEDKRKMIWNLENLPE